MRRRVILTILVLILYTLITTANPQYWDHRIYKWTGIPPYYDSELMEMYRWTRLVKRYGIKVGSERFERGEFE